MAYFDYYDHQKYCQNRRIDSDLVQCDRAIDDERNGFRIEDIAYALAEIMGENEGPNWHWIIAMKDHTYAYVTGGCDYTGWGCRDWGAAHIFVALKEALEAVPESERNILRGQLTGDIPFGADS